MVNNTFAKRFNPGTATLLLSLVFITLFALSAVPASGASDDFSVSFQQNIELCSCNSFKGDFVVQNNPDYVTMFTVSVSGDEGLVKGLIPQFVLSPGAEARFTEMVGIPCDFSGELNVTIDVVGGSVHKTYVQHISAGKCAPMKLYSAKQSLTIQPCSTASYNVLLENIASFKETFKISATDYEEYSLNDYSFELEPGKIASLNLSYRMPCSMNGNLTLPFRVHAVNSDYDLDSSLNLNIPSIYPFDVQATQKIRQCSESDGRYTMAIKNGFNPKLSAAEKQLQNSSSFTFDIVPVLPDEYSGESQKTKNQILEMMSSFVRPESRSFSIPFNSQATVGMIVDAKALRYGMQDDSQFSKLLGKELRYTVFITENMGMTRKEFPVTVTLDKCNSFMFSVEKESERVCSRLNKIGFNVKNTGKDALFIMSLSGDAKKAGLTLSSDSFYLKKDESKTGYLLLDPNSSVSGKFNIRLFSSMYVPYDRDDASRKIDLNDMSYSGKDQIELSERDISLEIIPKDGCYGLDVKAEKKRTEGNANITITVRNTGKFNENVSLFISDGDNFVFRTEDGYESKILNSMMLAPSEEKSIDMMFDPEDYSSYGLYTTYVNAKASGESSDADSTFDVSASGKSIVSYERKDSYLHRAIFLFAILFVLGFFIGMHTWRRKMDFGLILRVIVLSTVVLATVIALIGFFYFIASEYVLLVMSAFLGGIWAFFFGRFVLKHQDSKGRETRKTLKTKKMMIRITKIVFAVFALCILIGLLIVNPQYIDIVLKAAIFVIAALFLIKIIQIAFRALRIGVKKDDPAQITVAPVQTKVVEKVVEKIVYVEKPVAEKRSKAKAADAKADAKSKSNKGARKTRIPQ